MDIIQVNMCLEKGIRHVHFAPDFSLGAVSEEIINTQKRMSVKDCVCIQYLVVVYPTW
jgi:hypothetical protein